MKQAAGAMEEYQDRDDRRTDSGCGIDHVGGWASLSCGHVERSAGSCRWMPLFLDNERFEPEQVEHLHQVRAPAPRPVWLSILTLAD